MRPPRVLVLTGSAGHGHVKAGQALAAALRARHPSMEVVEADALAHLPRWFRETYRRAYLFLVDRAPGTWRRFYASTDRGDPPIGHFLTLIAGRRLARYVRDLAPDLVLCTHFLGPEVLAHETRRGRSSVPVHVAITDYDCHHAWYREEVEAYYVASDLVKARIELRWRRPKEGVHVTGIPVAAEFSQPRDLLATRARHALAAERPTVLFLSGGFSTGPMRASILGVWADRPDAQVVAVCGRNARLKRRLERMPRPAGATLRALGFVDDVPDLMAVADVVVGKSGGLTTAECFASGKPFVVSASIPGQEERNADEVMSTGAGVRAPTPEEVRWHVVRLLSDADARRETARRARAAGRPSAAADVADHVARRIGRTSAWAPPAHGAPALEPRGVT